MAGKGRLPRNDELVRTVGQDRRYRLFRLINQDALGSLWEGEDKDLRCPVAVRILSKAVAGDLRLVGELRARLEAVHGRLDHPRVAYVYGYSDRDGPEQYVVMEPMSGETLDQRLLRAGPLEPADALRLASEIADGLQAAHDVGLAHGGLTAGNVVLQSDGSVKLIDFGVTAVAPPSGPGRGGFSDDVSQLQALVREMVGGADPFASQGTLDPKAAGSSAGELASALRRAAKEAATRRAEEGRRSKEAAREAEEAARKKEMLRAELGRKTEDAYRRFEEARRAEEAARAEHARRADEARRAAEAREAEESRREEVAGRAEGAARHAEEARRAEEAARAEHALRMNEVRTAEEALRKAKALQTDFEGKTHDAGRPAEGLARTERGPGPPIAPNDMKGPKTPKQTETAEESERGSARAQAAAPADQTPRAGRRPSGGVALLTLRPDAGPERAETVRPDGLSLGLRPPAGLALRGRERTWLLGGITVLLVVVAGTLMAGRIGEEQTPTPPGSVERRTAPTVTVPDLRGLTAAEARDRLSEVGLALDSVVPVIDTPGLVRNNLPAPGETAAPGTGVILFLGVERDRFEEEVPTTP